MRLLQFLTNLFCIFVIIVMIKIYFSQNNPSPTKNLTIGFCGDTMLGRLVNEVITQKGYAYPWGNILPLLKENDLNIVNLETTLTKSKKKVFKVFNYKADPDKVQTIIEGKIDIVNLANNHILDFDQEGLLETLKTLDQKNIKYVGAGKNIFGAKKTVVIEKNNIKIGIIGYTNNEPSWFATTNKPGTNYIKVGDIATIKKDTEKIRKDVDLLILSIHWGPNMRQRPTKDFINFAHQIIESGVDIIHGHSAHIFQGIEIYKNKIIMYDTGDFVDDYRVDQILRNDQSFLFRIKVNKSGSQSIELIPVLISDMQVNVVKGELAKNILNKMKKLSSEFSTEVKIEKEKGFIKIKS